MSKDSLKAYRSVQVKTCDPFQLLLLLHEKILTEIHKAVLLLQSPPTDSQQNQVGYCLIKANLGVMELDRTLNFNVLPELADSLHKLYLHIILLLAEGLSDGNKESLLRAHSLLSQLRDTWDEAARQNPGARAAAV